PARCLPSAPRTERHHGALIDSATRQTAMRSAARRITGRVREICTKVGRISAAARSRRALRWDRKNAAAWPNAPRIAPEKHEWRFRRLAAIDPPPDAPDGPPVEDPPPSDPDQPGEPAGDPAPNEPGKWAL